MSEKGTQKVPDGWDATSYVRSEAMRILMDSTLKAVVTEVLPGEQHSLVYMREWSEEEPEGDKSRGRQSIVQLAQRLQRTREAMDMTVIHANAGGVLVEGKYFKAYIPVAQLSTGSTFKVRSLESKLNKQQQQEGSDNEDDKPAFGSPEEAARREAMNSLMGTKLSAVVTEVKVENANVMVYMAEQKFSAERLRRQLGKPVRAKVVDVRTFGCWLKFELEEEDGTKLPLHGLAHRSDMGWGPIRDARRVIKAGQHVDATLLGFDAKTGKVWLSTKRLQPIALDDMLNALVEESALPAPAPDSRTVLGTSFKLEMPMPEATDVAEALMSLPEVDTVETGRRESVSVYAEYTQVYLTGIAAAANRLAADSAAAEIATAEAEGTTAVAGVTPTADAQPPIGSEVSVPGQASASQGTSLSEPTASDRAVDSMRGPHWERPASLTLGITLVVHKGNHLQELLVDGNINRRGLQLAIDQILARLLAEDSAAA